jgi:hypothetical protein
MQGGRNNTARYARTGVRPASLTIGRLVQSVYTKKYGREISIPLTAAATHLAAPSAFGEARRLDCRAIANSYIGRGKKVSWAEDQKRD